MAKALFLGITGSLFFAFTFILNQQMNLSGGSWLWSASLRYLFTLPILLVIIISQKQMKDVINHIKKQPVPWFIWSTVGFGIFYAPMTFASAYGASWLVAGTWQLTIIAGILLTPLFYENIVTESGVVRSRKKIPKVSLMLSLIILGGVLLMQFQNAKSVSLTNAIIGIIPVLLGAFAYPLGNRKMMEICDHSISTLQRIFGMTLCSMPFWIIIAAFGFSTAGLPSKNQLFQSAIVAVFSGVVATLLFFKATDLVKADNHKLAVVESTQSGEVIFTMLGGVFLFHDRMPTLIDGIGILLVVIGIILNGLSSFDFKRSEASVQNNEPL